MAERLLHALLVQTLALSLAVVVVRALQALLVRRLGAGAAYLCWLLVPVAMGVVVLPHASSGALVVRVDVSAIASAWAGAVPATHVAGAGMLASIAVSAWTVGALSLAALLARRQRRFDALVTRPNGALARLPAGAGPAVIGVLKPCVALPQDFETTFDAEERRLVLLHEGVHLSRRDNTWNLLASALLVAHWFNPIAWWAWRRLRADQELACDAAVLRREPPEAVASYAGALLKVQGVALTPPLATAWQSTHPLVERVRMLQLHRISSARHRAGLRVAALSIVLAGVGGYTLQAGADALPAAVPGNTALVMTSIDVTQTAHTATAPGVSTQNVGKLRMGVVARMGEQAIIQVGARKGGEPFEVGVTVSRLGSDRLQVDARVSVGSPLALLGSPRLVLHDGEKGSVAIDTGVGAGAFTIALTPKVVAGSEAGALDMPKPPALPSPPTQPLPALPALSPVSALPPLPAMPAAPTPQSLPALPALPAVPAPPPQRAL